jgi:hypothetical protein
LRKENKKIKDKILTDDDLTEEQLEKKYNFKNLNKSKLLFTCRGVHVPKSNAYFGSLLFNDALDVKSKCDNHWQSGRIPPGKFILVLALIWNRN